MCQENHLDKQLFSYFLQSKLWLDYAQEHLVASQIDEVDVDALLRLANSMVETV